MAKSRKKKSTTSEEEEVIVVYGHTNVVFTWPLIMLGYFFMVLSGIGVQGSWMSWVYIFVHIYILVALTIDIKRGLGIMLIVVSILCAIICVLFWIAFKVDLVFQPIMTLVKMEQPYPAALFNMVTIVMSILWLFDSVYSWLFLQFRFTSTSFRHKQWMDADKIYKIEGVVTTVFITDWLELGLWGSMISISNPTEKYHIDIPNVWNHEKVYERLNAILPGDVKGVYEE